MDINIYVHTHTFEMADLLWNVPIWLWLLSNNLQKRQIWTINWHLIIHLSILWNIF